MKTKAALLSVQRLYMLADKREQRSIRAWFKELETILEPREDIERVSIRKVEHGNIQ